MNYTPDILRKLKLAGALFGLVLGAVLAWTVYIYPYFALREVPISTASFNLDLRAIVASTVICVIGATVGGFLVAHFWERLGLAILFGALATMIVRTIPSYLVTTANIENNPFGAYILFQLPFALIFGALLSFLGGTVGSAVERVILSGAARLLQGRRWMAALGWLTVVAGGALLGYAGGGNDVKTDDVIAAAKAVDSAIRIAGGQQVSSEDLPPGFLVSKPALGTLQGLGPRIQQPYQISLGEHDGIEVVTDTRFQDGLEVRCVSRAARISRCFEESP